jgi:hypothetical protein
MVTHGDPVAPFRRTLYLPLAAALTVACLAAGCTFEDGHPPVPRASATPRAIPENDGFQTAVTLDATRSADPLDDPEGVRPLRYMWHISSDEFRFESGDETDPTPVVRFRGARPATIELTVTDADGLDATARFELQLTVSE